MSADIGSIGDLGGEREKSIFIMQFFMESCAEGGKVCWVSVAGDEAGGDRCDTFCSPVPVGKFLVLRK